MRLAAVSLIALTACAAPTLAQPATDTGWLDGAALPALLDCAREQDVTLLQAHRAGDRPGAAENSLGAIEASLADGAVFIEIDVASTSDGVLVLLHDDALERTTTGEGEISDTTYAEFSALQLVDVDGAVLPEAPPSFAAALEALDGRGIAQVDLKDISFEAVAAALVAADAVDRSVVITYSIEDAITLAGLLPEAALSVGVRQIEDLDRLVAGGVDLTQATIWLGVGTGRPALDAALADLEIETSYGDFRGERNGTVDYRRLADNGAEVISVDDVPAAAAALDASRAARALLARCPTAQP